MFKRINPKKKKNGTRLHSSRMRTARALTVSPSMLCWGRGLSALGGGGLLWGMCLLGGWGCLLWVVSALGGVSASGGCLSPGGVCSGDVSAPGGVCSGGSAAGGCIPAGTEADTPLLTESRMPVKT